MSENADVNFKDNSNEKMSSDKNINSIDKDTTETETSTSIRSGENSTGTGATSHVNNLNKQSEDHVVEKVIELVTQSQTDSIPNESGALKLGVKEEAVMSGVESPPAAADSEDSKISKQEELKMNIELEAGKTSDHQSVSKNSPGHSPPEKSANEQTDEDQAKDEEKECVQRGPETVKTACELNLKGEDDPSKVDEPSTDKTDDNCIFGREKEKSDSENEEKTELQTGTGKGSSPEEEVKKINAGQGGSSVDPGTGSGSGEENDEALEASGGAENSKEKKATEREEEDKNLKPSSFLSKSFVLTRRQWGEHDTGMYRACYPGKEDFPHLTDNLDFYQGRIKCRPNGDYIDNIHQEWWDDYEWLEFNHSYIQWLFPIRESGMNYAAQELQLHEAEAIQADPKAMERVVMSYTMMLNFYGIHLVSAQTGEVARAKNWKKRFSHLNYSMHNYLRITRILKCLGELGLERLKSPFLHFMLHEAMVTRCLDRTLESCYNYWIGTIRDDEERESIYDYAMQLSDGDSELLMF